MSEWRSEVKAGRRFQFGRNWRHFLEHLDDSRIEAARASILKALGGQDLKGQTFLDVGCGSGLFSLAAKQLGAARVHSFDYDKDSVACAEEVKRRYFAASGDWSIQEGSALDSKYIQSLGKWDIVYSWGVLHHTGNMWEACRTVAGAVRPGGRFFISLYNDQGLKSRVWKGIKAFYNLGWPARGLVWCLFVPPLLIIQFLKQCIRLRNPLPTIGLGRKGRGMTFFHDYVDWLGGYPFEYATPAKVKDFFTQEGFELLWQNTTTSLGCNEFVFRRVV